MTDILDASSVPPPSEAIGRAAQVLRRGVAAVIPTDTVYGLAADPRRTAALFHLKGRPVEVALPVLVADIDQALALADDGLPPVVLQLMERWWPGALTLVVPRRDGLGLELGGGDDASVGLRLPAHPVPVALAAAAGPLAVTSANRHGRPTPTTAREVLAQLGSGVALALDAGPCRGEPSTVVAWGAGGLQVLREGTLPSAEIFAGL